MTDLVIPCWQREACCHTRLPLHAFGGEGHRPSLCSMFAEQRLLVGGSSRNEKKPEIAAQAPSILLGRLQAFLPQMQAANSALQDQLQRAPADAVGMERSR